MKLFRDKKGITLVELMTIVVIIGLVSAMAIPRLSKTINRLQFKSATKEMLSSLRLARSNAISQKQQFGVYLDNTNKTVVLFQDISNPALFSYDVSDSILAVDTLPEDFVLTATSFTNQSIVYQPNGSASGSGIIVLLAYTEDDDIQVGVLDILASTGRTKISYINYY